MPIDNEQCRLRVEIGGLVQGVGFRPFVYRLARELELTGWVNNSPRGVTLEVEGRRAVLETLLLRLQSEQPPPAAIQSLEPRFLDPVGFAGFEIRQSAATGERGALVLPDIATCGECVRELFDPSDRRYRYPFINCTHCGPRYSIVEALPYDRANTTMRKFAMCPSCQAEYQDPGNRRFHAQPNACPDCGPQLALWDRQGRIVARREAALAAVVREIRRGAVVAIKGLGGFQLLVDAGNPAAVGHLRTVKNREEKPFALMYPTLRQVRAHCAVSPLEERLLGAPEAPIVLVEWGVGAQALASGVAPGNPLLGVMLPYTPLHHLLMGELGTPVVATSGNRMDEPICIEEQEVLERLGGIAEWFLVHDRPIRRHVDDSIVRVAAGRELVLRRARGYAPLPIHLDEEGPAVLAVGAQLKNVAAVGAGRDVFLTQHIGDLETAEAYGALQRVCVDLRQLLGVRPLTLACDLHPDYRSTHLAVRLAREEAAPCLAVQHHYAHVLACMAENQLHGRVLGVAWDGAGYGNDHTVWGGEFLLATRDDFERVAHLRTFRLPGGERAVKEPRRTALGVLYELFGEQTFAAREWAPVRAFAPEELRVVAQMLRRVVNSPLTSSAGRLFDAVAALVGLRQRLGYEGQGAMELEFGVEPGVEEGYPLELITGQRAPWIVDWEPLIRALLADLETAVPLGRMAARFHNGLVEGILSVARQAGEERVALTGGCMQNKYLLELVVCRLQQEGFRPYWHQRVPPNDGGIALGQAIAARRRG